MLSAIVFTIRVAVKSRSSSRSRPSSKSRLSFSGHGERFVLKPEPAGALIEFVLEA